MAGRVCGAIQGRVEIPPGRTRLAPVATAPKGMAQPFAWNMGTIMQMRLAVDKPMPSGSAMAKPSR